VTLNNNNTWRAFLGGFPGENPFFKGGGAITCPHGSILDLYTHEITPCKTPWV